MTIYSQSAQANAAGAATVSIAVNKSGIQWAVAQYSVEARPAAPAGICTVKLNGNFLDSTVTLPATSSGSPAITLQAQDQLTFDFTGLAVGSTGVVTLYYVESTWGTIPDVTVV
jgi:hypothetical protein